MKARGVPGTLKCREKSEYIVPGRLPPRGVLKSEQMGCENYDKDYYSDMINRIILVEKYE